MPISRRAACVLVFGVCVSGGGPACAQSYPVKPVRIVTGGAGGSVDLNARVVAQGLTASLGQQVVVENRSSGVIPGDIVSKAAPDGYTLLFTTGIAWLLPFLLNKVPYDPVTDFAPVILTASSPNVLVVNPSLPAKSVKEVIALAKARPGVLNYASTGDGGGAHLAAELFKAMAGVNIVRIPYKGGGDALNDVISGQVQMMFATVASGMPHVRTGRLSAVAVTSAEPSALVPGLPTLAASGLPGYESVAVFGMLAPARTPASLIQRLNQAVVRSLGQPEMKERMSKVGVDFVGSSPQQFAAAIKADMSRMGKVIREAGIRGE